MGRCLARTQPEGTLERSACSTPDGPDRGAGGPPPLAPGREPPRGRGGRWRPGLRLRVVADEKEVSEFSLKALRIDAQLKAEQQANELSHVMSAAVPLVSAK